MAQDRNQHERLTAEDGESAADAVIALYEALADRYIAERGRGMAERAWLERFLAQVPAPRRILDIGCGAGAPSAAYLLGRGCTLTGIDSSPALIAHCRRRLPAAQWQVGDMRALQLGAQFDGLIAWDSLFHLTHAAQRAMFGRFRAHAAPAAALLFTSGPAHGTSIGRYHGRALYHASLDGREYRALLEEHGFSVREHVVSDPDCGEHTVWLAKMTTP